MLPWFACLGFTSFKKMLSSIKNFFMKLFSRGVEDSSRQNLQLKRRLDDCKNGMPVKLAKFETPVTSQPSRSRRTPLTSNNWNSAGSEMADEVNASAGRRLLNAGQECPVVTLPESDPENDDDVQVLRVYESLESRAARQRNVTYGSKSRLDLRRIGRLGLRTKAGRRTSTLDQAEDLDQHRRYKALLHESSAFQNSGYRNDSLLEPASGTDSSLQVKRAEPDLNEFSLSDADFPSSGSAEMIMLSAQHTTNWITNLEEKRRRSFREEMTKAEKTRELAQRLHKHNEKMVQEVEKKQWDLRSAFEIFKIEEESRALPTLTPQMEEVVRRALVSHPENEKMVSASKITITRKDINTLRGLNWLNDEVINCYMELIKERSSSSNGKYPKVFTFNTFFYSNLCSRGNAFLKRWNRKVDLFAYDMILAPIHEGVHWCMVQIDFRSKRMLYLDSMGGKNKRCLELFLGYFTFESKERNVPFNPDEWRLEFGQDNPKQTNGCDCGVFSCMYAEFLSRDAKFMFDQSDMPFLRRKMVYELLHGLLPI
ncbi:sentrin-specific protease 1-like isoform X2 [Bacillus rossius redtenbacheri]|uniref:sentrin-specific protease 1-like isoform X2 n=1 Tax=Bacillus rossius redtenbacheri TaxID=93214 RepID=UPI002FDDC8E5